MGEYKARISWNWFISFAGIRL